MRGKSDREEAVLLLALSTMVVVVSAILGNVWWFIALLLLCGVPLAVVVTGIAIVDAIQQRSAREACPVCQSDTRSVLLTDLEDGERWQLCLPHDRIVKRITELERETGIDTEQL